MNKKIKEYLINKVEEMKVAVLPDYSVDQDFVSDKYGYSCGLSADLHCADVFYRIGRLFSKYSAANSRFSSDLVRSGVDRLCFLQIVN